MAWRLDNLVLAGELDNTQFGWTIGWLELAGFPERLQLKLAGNCHPDLAGWKFRIKRVLPTFENDDERGLPVAGISLAQSGHVGDITADQMIKHFDLPHEEVARRLHAKETLPFTWRKCLYLEWYSNSNGRVVIQSTRLEVERLGERAFELTADECNQQADQNQEELEYFMTQLENALDRRNVEDV